jgi:serine O-acetyltransferase
VSTLQREVNQHQSQVYDKIKTWRISMRFKEYKFLVKSDLYRHTGKIRVVSFLKQILLNPGFKCTFWMRTCAFMSQSRIILYSIFFIARIIGIHYNIKYGISIPHTTKIGSGFYVGHFGCIIVNDKSVIGKNCNISQGVTIGLACRGKNKGCPIIGDNVYIGPGAKIIGRVNVGNNVAIGANCVVTKDVPDNAVVAGVPGRIISYKGSEGYVCRTNYSD